MHNVNLYLFLALKLTSLFFHHTRKKKYLLQNLPIFHFPFSVGFVFVLNLAEGASSINLLCNPAPTWNGFVFSPTIMNGTPPIVFGLTLSMITPASF